VAGRPCTPNSVLFLLSFPFLTRTFGFDLLDPPSHSIPYIG